MRKIFLVLIVMSMIACNKEQDEISNNTNNGNSTATPKFRGDDHKISIMAIQAGACIPPAINCVVLPEVVITALQIALLDHAEDSGSPEEVAELFLGDHFDEVYG